MSENSNNLYINVSICDIIIIGNVEISIFVYRGYGVRFNPILNDKLEVECYEFIEKSGEIVKSITVTPYDNFSHIRKTIFDGEDKIYTQEFTLDDEVLEYLVDIKNGKLI